MITVQDSHLVDYNSLLVQAPNGRNSISVQGDTSMSECVYVCVCGCESKRGGLLSQSVRE